MEKQDSCALVGCFLPSSEKLGLSLSIWLLEIVSIRTICVVTLGIPPSCVQTAKCNFS